MDGLDIAIVAMVEAGLSDRQILQLVRVRVRYAREPTWPPPDAARLGFARFCAEKGRIGQGDRFPSAETIQTIERRLDFAGMASERNPGYSGNPSSIRQVVDGADEP